MGCKFVREGTIFFVTYPAIDLSELESSLPKIPLWNALCLNVNFQIEMEIFVISGLAHQPLAFGSLILLRAVRFESFSLGIKDCRESGIISQTSYDVQLLVGLCEIERKQMVFKPLAHSAIDTTQTVKNYIFKYISSDIPFLRETP